MKQLQETSKIDQDFNQKGITQIKQKQNLSKGKKICQILWNVYYTVKTDEQRKEDGTSTTLSICTYFLTSC